MKLTKPILIILLLTTSALGQTVQGGAKAQGGTTLGNSATVTPQMPITPTGSTQCYNPSSGTCGPQSITVNAGDVIVLSATRATGAAAATVTGCATNWSNSTYTSGTWAMQTSTGIATTSGTCSITVASSNVAQAWVAQAYSGVSSVTNPTYNPSVQSSATSCVSPTISVGAGSDIVGMFFVLGTPTITPATGTNLRVNANMTTARMEITDRNSPTATTVTTGINISPAADCVAAAVELTIAGVTPPPPPPGALTVTSPVCGPAVVGSTYQCIITATGGTAPYTWSATGLPSPLTMATVSGNGVISGTPSATSSGTVNVTVTDSATPAPASASASFTLTVVEAGACGPPTYGCSRLDYISLDLKTATDVPPTPGCQPVAWADTYAALSPPTAYSGQQFYRPCGPNNESLHPCTAGERENPANPAIDAAAGPAWPAPSPGHAFNLASCGDVYGLNVIMSDPKFSPHAQILRITDINDFPICPNPAAYLSQMDGTNHYVVIPCSNTAYVKYIDPVAFQVNTSVDPRGYVRCPVAPPLPDGCSRGADQPWQVPAGTPSRNYEGRFYGRVGSQVIYNTVVNGRVTATLSTPLFDMFWGSPCTRGPIYNPSNMTSVNSSGQAIDMCKDWQPSHSYRAGSIITPSTNNYAGTSNGFPIAHSFALMNNLDVDCVSGDAQHQPQWEMIAPLSGYPGVIITSASLTTVGGNRVAHYNYSVLQGQVNPAMGQAIMPNQRVTVLGATSANLNVTQTVVTAATAAYFEVQCQVMADNGTCSTALSATDIPDTAQTTARTFSVPRSQGGGNGTNTAQPSAQTILYDGTCRWADIWSDTWGGNPNVGGNKVGGDDDINFRIGWGNNRGQDQAGVCFNLAFLADTKTYSSMNNCTGSVYNTICTNSAALDCSGGTWTRTYLGNVYVANLYYTDYTQVARKMPARGNWHQSNGTAFMWTSQNTCAWADTVGGVECQYSGTTPNGGCLTSAPTGTAPCGSALITLFWNFGTVNAGDQAVLLGNGATTGHITDVGPYFIYSATRDANGNQVPNAATTRAQYRPRLMVPWHTDVGAAPGYWIWDSSVGPCTQYPATGVPSSANGGCLDQQSPCTSAAGSCPDPTPTTVNGVAVNGNSDCIPYGCWGARTRNASGVSTITGRRFRADKHMVFAGIPPQTIYQACVGTYIGQTPEGVVPTALFGDAGDQWPRWPWGNEYLCFPLDRSNRIFRQGNIWQFQGSVFFYVQYNYEGSPGPSGSFAPIASDWWCTTGGGVWANWTNGTGIPNAFGGNPRQAALCGIPIQYNYPYQGGEYVGAPNSTPTTTCESGVYKVVQAGTSGTNKLGCGAANGVQGGATISAPDIRWNCGGNQTSDVRGRVGCYVGNGNTVFQYVGKTNALYNIYLIKMQ